MYKRQLFHKISSKTNHRKWKKQIHNQHKNPKPHCKPPLLQLPIYLLHFIIFYPITLFLDCQRAAFRLPFLLTYTRSLSTQFPPHMPLYYLSIQPISSDPAFSVVPSHLVFPQSALPRFPPTLWPPDRLGSDVPSAPQSSINTGIVPVYALSGTVSATFRIYHA